jgi:DsbC/DsbD-like thiol-disulfide interchange protein
VATAVFGWSQANTPPTVTVSTPTNAVHGKEITVTVKITFAEGLHGYQNPPSNPDLIPIKISLDSKDIKIKSIKYPEGKDESVGGDPAKVRVYEGTINVPVKIMAPKKKGKVKLSFRLDYQQCNSQACYPPDQVSSTASLNVK